MCPGEQEMWRIGEQHATSQYFRQFKISRGVNITKVLIKLIESEDLESGERFCCSNTSSHDHADLTNLSLLFSP